MIAFLFPGQGSQRPGMLRGVDALPGGSATIAEGNDIFGADVRNADDVAAYRSTVAAQRALFVAGVASARALAAADVRADAVAGHSVGAFAAAVSAGALAFADAARLVDLRARLMQGAFADGYAMGAVGGLDERAVTALASLASNDDTPVYAANINAPDQVVVSGNTEAVNAVLDAARVRGARSVRRLEVHVPSHTPLMRHIADELADAAARVAVTTPAMRYASNADGRIVRDAEAVRGDLSASLTRPVRWYDATRALYESGVRLFVEMLPATVLTELAAYAFPDARAVALETAGIASVAVLARRYVI
ncbi:MAG: ACP S-malonyltransferase [Candidatus Velthaea sp.]